MTIHTTLLRRLTLGVSAAACAALLAVSMPSQAAPMSHGKMMPKMSHGKMMSGKAVYACAECKMFYTPAQAKSMKFMDPMGHKLTKMSKAPAGFMPGSKMMDKSKM